MRLDNRRTSRGPHQQPWLGLAAALALTACSCRLPESRFESGTSNHEMSDGYACDDDGPHAPGTTTRAPGSPPPIPGYDRGIPIPQTIVTPWSPPGIAGPWPHDEYLQDGGDRDVQVTVAPDFNMGGLDAEDTVIHYDTIDGRTIVKPTNKVCIYAPRFGAVRKVTSVQLSEQSDALVEAELPVKASHQDETLIATTAIQPVQPRGQLGVKRLSIERLDQPAGRISQRLLAAGVENREKAYEDFAVIRQGVIEESEKARLAISVDAAITWTHDKAVQVILDSKQAIGVTSDQKVQTTFRADLPTNPCLRVIKVASTNMARPGDIVDFTIRFDNVGDQTIGNVTLVDNLTTRLEYVEGSAKSSRTADFITDRNEGDSLTLRWEFTEPLQAGAGGLVRFHCRVR